MSRKPNHQRLRSAQGRTDVRWAHHSLFITAVHASSVATRNSLSASPALKWGIEARDKHTSLLHVACRGSYLQIVRHTSSAAGGVGGTAYIIGPNGPNN
ncbi:hypothetical protein ACLOJK_016549 [Asimina triloba]